MTMVPTETMRLMVVCVATVIMTGAMESGDVTKTSDFNTGDTL